METLVALLAWTIDKVWPFPVFIICLVLIVLGIARLMGVQQGSVPLMVLLVLLMICIPFGTPALFMFGPRWVAPLVYEYGTPGQAVIASSKDTGNVYINRPSRCRRRMARRSRPTSTVRISTSIPSGMPSPIPPRDSRFRCGISAAGRGISSS